MIFLLMMKTFPELPSESGANGLSIFNPSGFSLPFSKQKLLDILETIETSETIRFKQIELVYVDEENILKINKTHLNRDYVTDIISFRYDEENDQAIEGTLFCCAPRIQEQSTEFGTDTQSEFLRVFVHGLLHLAGYDDQTEKQKLQMRDLEDKYLFSGEL